MIETIHRIVEHARSLTPSTPLNERLAKLRRIIRLAQDEYDVQLARSESLNAVHADPALALPIAEDGS